MPCMCEPFFSIAQLFYSSAHTLHTNSCPRAGKGLSKNVHTSIVHISPTLKTQTFTERMDKNKIWYIHIMALYNSENKQMSYIQEK